MAEFAEVIRQYSRMCEYPKKLRCEECPIGSVNNGTALNCTVLMLNEPAKAEKIIMRWAVEHPEPKYPTWHEWQHANFEGHARYICPMVFAVPCPCKSVTSANECTKCRDKPIPVEIAAKLGIKPIGGAQDENA